MNNITLNEYKKLAIFYRDTLDLYIAPVEKPTIDIDGKVEKSKNGKDKYYKVMPVGYKGRYHGKDDYIREVSDEEIEDWYNEGFGLAVITKGWSEKYKKFQRVYDIDSFGGLTKEEFWQKYGDDLCFNFVTESFKGYHIFVMSDVEITISKFIIETGDGDIFMGDNRYGTKSGHTVEPPSRSVNDSTWEMNGQYKIANFIEEPEDLPRSWVITNYSAVKQNYEKIKTNEGVDTIRNILDGKSQKGKGQGVYDINLKFIGKKVGEIKDKDDLDLVEKALKKCLDYNAKHAQGYSDEEIKDTFYSILKKEIQKTKMNPVEVDMKVIEKAGGLIIQDVTDGLVYIQIDGKHNMVLKSANANRWIIQNIGPKDKAQIGNLLMRLDANISKRVKLQYRITRNEDGFICYNIGDDKGTIVTIKKGSWDCGDSPDINLFKPCAGQKAQVIPMKGGDLNDIFEFINIEEKMRPLFLCYLVFCFVPDVQYPLVNMFGEKGSGKSSAASMSRSLNDPNVVDFDGIDAKKMDDTRVALSSCHMSVIDNISNISQDFSDLLCVMSTGGAHKKRVLYSDGDVHISQIIKPIILTSVTQEMRREDLLSRTILAEVKVLGKTIAPNLLAEGFNKKKPLLLGSIFDILSQIDIHSVSKDGLVRMADFHMYSRAIAKVLGFDDIIDGLIANNFEQQEEEAIENSDSASAVLNYMYNKITQTLSAGEWCHELGFGEKKQPSWFSKDLVRLSGSLKSIGIVVEFLRSTHKREIKITNMQNVGKIAKIVGVDKNYNNIVVYE